MEQDIDNSSHVKSFYADGIHSTDVVEWSKKRKPESDQLDLHRPKHKCWDKNSSADARMFGENPMLGSMHINLVKGGKDATLHDDSSEPESARDSNSFVEDSNTAMSNEEGKLEVDSAKACLYGRPSNIFDDWDGIKKSQSSEKDKFVDSECEPSSLYAELHALQNLKEQFLGLGSHTDHTNSEYAKDNFEESVDEEFEDVLYGENPNMFVLSSGRWSVSQEAQSSARPPTIDQEFEQYFSMLML